MGINILVFSFVILLSDKLIALGEKENDATWKDKIRWESHLNRGSRITVGEEYVKYNIEGNIECAVTITKNGLLAIKKWGFTSYYAFKGKEKVKALNFKKIKIENSNEYHSVVTVEFEKMKNPKVLLQKKINGRPILLFNTECELIIKEESLEDNSGKSLEFNEFYAANIDGKKISEESIEADGIIGHSFIKPPTSVEMLDPGKFRVTIAYECDSPFPSPQYFSKIVEKPSPSEFLTTEDVRSFFTDTQRCRLKTRELIEEKDLIRVRNQGEKIYDLQFSTPLVKPGIVGTCQLGYHRGEYHRDKSREFLYHRLGKEIRDFPEIEKFRIKFLSKRNELEAQVYTHERWKPIFIYNFGPSGVPYWTFSFNSVCNLVFRVRNEEHIVNIFNPGHFEKIDNSNWKKWDGIGSVLQKETDQGKTCKLGFDEQSLYHQNGNVLVRNRTISKLDFLKRRGFLIIRKKGLAKNGGRQNGSGKRRMKQFPIYKSPIRLTDDWKVEFTDECQLVLRYKNKNGEDQTEKIDLFGMNQLGTEFARNDNFVESLNNAKPDLRAVFNQEGEMELELLQKVTGTGKVCQFGADRSGKIFHRRGNEKISFDGTAHSIWGWVNRKRKDFGITFKFGGEIRELAVGKFDQQVSGNDWSIEFNDDCDLRFIIQDNRYPIKLKLN